MELNSPTPLVTCVRSMEYDNLKSLETLPPREVEIARPVDVLVFRICNPSTLTYGALIISAPVLLLDTVKLYLLVSQTPVCRSVGGV